MFNNQIIKTMNFRQAIEALKEGKKVTRKGWNGKKMFLWLKPSAVVKAQWCKDPILKDIADQNGGEVDALGTICMKTADNKVLAGWLASQTDMLSEDWKVIDSNVTSEKPKTEDAQNSVVDTAIKALSGWTEEDEKRRGFILITAEEIEETKDGKDMNATCAVFGPNGILVRAVGSALDNSESPLKEIITKSAMCNFLENIIKK